MTESETNVMKSYSVTDVGQKRNSNQDFVYTNTESVGKLPNLFIVADGMGGHNAGEFASTFTVETIVEHIKGNLEENPIKILRTAIEHANKLLIEESHKNQQLAGMGTTIVAVTIVGHFAYVANVGDSRLYVINEEIYQVTKDHSLVEEMVRLGEISREDAKHHPDKNVITRAIGATQEVAIDFFDYQLNEKHKILLCTDGLTNMVDDSNILKIVNSSGAIEMKSAKLVELANDNGGKDNITVVIIEPFTNEVEEC